MVSQGRVPYHTHDEFGTIRQTVGDVLLERHIRWSDRRLLLIYLMLVILVSGVFYYLSSQQHRSDSDRIAFEKAALANCHAIQANQRGFNAFVDTLIAQVETTSSFTDAEKSRRKKFYSAAKGSIPPCPPEVLPGAGR